FQPDPHSLMHNQDTMALLWNPESWAQRLAELEAQSGDLKEAPLRRDVRSLGTLLGAVLREQAGEAHADAEFGTSPEMKWIESMGSCDGEATSDEIPASGHICFRFRFA